MKKKNHMQETDLQRKVKKVSDNSRGAESRPASTHPLPQYQDAELVEAVPSGNGCGNKTQASPGELIVRLWWQQAMKDAVQETIAAVEKEIDAICMNKAKEVGLHIEELKKRKIISRTDVRELGLLQTLPLMIKSEVKKKLAELRK